MRELEMQFTSKKCGLGAAVEALCCKSFLYVIFDPISHLV